MIKNVPKAATDPQQLFVEEYKGWYIYKAKVHEIYTTYKNHEPTYKDWLEDSSAFLRPNPSYSTTGSLERSRELIDKWIK